MTRKPSLSVKVHVTRLAHNRDLPLPAYQTSQSAGLDLVAAVPAAAPITIAAAARALIPAGLVLQLPTGFEAQVRPRSGLALKYGVTVLNSPGTIDSDYRGEVMVLLINLGAEPFVVRRGERIAQLVIAPVAKAALVEISGVSATARGAGGFGSTGTSAATKEKKTMPAKPRGVKSSTRKSPPAHRKMRPPVKNAQ